MSLREWLIAIGTLVVLGIVIDGIRRMRRARKESMAISSGMGVDKLDESPLDDHYNPELPNGGARAISRDTLEDRGYVRKAGRTRFGKTEQKPTRPIVASTPSHEEPLWSDDEEPSWSDDEEVAADDVPTLETDSTDARVDAEAEWSDTIGEEDFEGLSAETFAEVPEDTITVEENTANRGQPQHDASQPLAGANRPPAQEVVVINVLAGREQAFEGQAVKDLFEACGLAYGDMEIYHRHEQPDTISPVQFSVANVVEPGTFRPQDIPAMTTPGISFFMSLPGPTNSMQAFDFMLETAQCVVRNLGGELKDENRSVMTAQTIEHCRQRIREYERKKRSPRS